MKKCVMIFILVGILGLCLTACEKAQPRDTLFGTWKIAYVEYEGSKFTVDEWKTTEDEDLSENFIVLKEGGKAYIYEDEYGYLENWLSSDDSIMIDDEIYTLSNGLIGYDYYGTIWYFEKVSDSQTIPSTEAEDISEDEEGNSEYDSDEETEETATGASNSTTATKITTTTILTTTSTKKAETNTSWRQFLKDYEAWVDDYIAITKKYEANPSDLSILSDYMKMVGDVAEWTDRADEIEAELEDPEEALEYSQELLRIANKLAEAAY